MTKIYSLLLVALLGTSCMNFLETEPQGSISDEQLQDMIEKNPAKVLAPMLASTVGSMQKYSRDNSVVSKGFMVYNLALDMMGNDLVLFPTNNAWFQTEYELRNYREQIYGRAADYWTFYYKLIYQANQILDLIPQNNENPETEVYKASALTIRAMSYYYLISLYQDAYLHGGKDKTGVPLYTSNSQGSKGRGSAAEVWQQIGTDLNEAIALFEKTGHDWNKSKTDVDITVAHAILARTALTMGDWEQAEKSASFVMEKYPTLTDETAYTTSGFQQLSLPETIWGYQYDLATSNGNNSFAGHMSVISVGGYGGSQGGWKGIDKRLYDKMSDSDYRKKNFCATETPYTYAPGTKEESHVIFPAQTNMKFASSDFNQDEVYMRVSEMYFIKAEALARNGNPGDAQQTLFDIIHERDQNYALPTLTGSALLDEINVQKRIELWGEGFEFLENKRLNKAVNRMDSPNHAYKTTVNPGVAFTFQIPLTQEIETNPLINAADQNP